jgi:hypothetical protein
MLNSKKDDLGRYLYEVEPGRWVSRQRVHQLRNIKAHRARLTIILAINYGSLKRQPCEICGKPNAQVHHLSYENAYAIQWLCKNHHDHAKPHLLKGTPIPERLPAGRKKGKRIPPLERISIARAALQDQNSPAA